MHLSDAEAGETPLFGKNSISTTELLIGGEPEIKQEKKEETRITKITLPLFLIIVRIDWGSHTNECAGHYTLDEKAHPLPHVTHHPMCMLLWE